MDRLTREVRAELLAAAAPEEVVGLSDRLIGADLAYATVVKPPKVGLVMMQVREPVERSRFHLGEVLAVECTVEFAGSFGWSMREGDDRAAALAGAVLDAVAESGDPRAVDVDQFCREVAARREAARVAEWREIAPTVVEFEELP